MNATTINRLVSLDPNLRREEKKISTSHDSIQRFVQVYANPAFGWYIAGRYAQCKKPLPVVMMGSDKWVFRAWLMRLDPNRWYDIHIAEAYALNSLASLKMSGEKLKSCLLASCKDPLNKANLLRNIVEESGVSFDTLDAFESLFYNIFDRATDNLYLSNELYPNTRAVELREDYLKTVDVADLIKRAAFNNKDVRMTLYMAGIGGSDYLASLSERPDREAELSKRIMGNALVLAAAGLINQRSIGLSRGQTLLAASRAGGAVEESSPLEGIGQHLVEQLYLIGQDADDVTMRVLRKAAGETSDASAATVDV